MTADPPVPSLLRPGASLLLVGEAPGEQETILREPFIGSAGQELRRMLADAGLSFDECSITNVFPIRPPDNKIEAFCGKKESVGGKSYSLPPLRQGLYIRPEYLHHLESLKELILNCNPVCIVALGAVAAWALLQDSRITKLRGTVAPCALVPGYKVLPTFHPAYILRTWADRVVAVADLMKAKAEQHSREIHRPQRRVHIIESVGDLPLAEDLLARGGNVLSFDIETGAKQIKCISLATSPFDAVLLPFVDFRRPKGSFWQSPSDEVLAWRWLKGILESPIPKLAQNGLYDIQYLLEASIRVRNYTWDTMILHHSLWPELKKDLGFLGSLYTQEPAWKLMRTRSGDLKREE